MDEQTLYFSTGDGAKLFMRRWTPGAGRRVDAVLLIVHGMAEHSGRYAFVAEKMTACGIEVWSFDLRGHGKTADTGINSPAAGGLLGHCCDKKAFLVLLSDIEAFRAEVERIRPDVPLFLLGHSFGSFLVQGYIESRKRPIAGCILSGTRGPSTMPITAAAYFFTVYRFIRGRRHISRFAANLIMGGHNARFRPNRTPCDWLSRDTAAVDSHISDPYCGKTNSLGFFTDMLWILKKIHTSSAIAKIRKDLPVYLFSGSDDPVGDRGKNVTNLVKKYKQEGLTDIELVLYPNARHEPLNEVNREEVMDNLIDWIKRHEKEAVPKQPLLGQQPVKGKLS